MSYQQLSNYSLVACDACGSRGAIGDFDWHQMRRTAAGTPVHLCRHCRHVAVWCEAHQRYHRPTDHHRCACAECGGLFTTSAASGIFRCPGCQRAHAPDQPSVERRRGAARPAGILARLWALVLS